VIIDSQAVRIDQQQRLEPSPDNDDIPPGSPDKRSRRRRSSQLLGYAVSALALAAVVWWISRQERPLLPTSAGALTVLVLAVLVHSSTMVVRGWRWHVILRESGICHQLIDAYALVAVGYMGNVVLPARGGELLRVILMHQRSSGRRREILGTIVAERTLDVISLVVLLSVVTFAGVAGTPAGPTPALGGLAALAVGVVTLAVYLRLRRRGLMSGFADKIRPVAASSRKLMTWAGALLTIMSVGIWLLEGLVFTLAARSVDLELSVLEGAFLVVIANFFALIPAAPGYVGTYDAAVLFGLAALKVPHGVAVGVAILARFVAFVPITVIGFLLLVARYGGLNSLRRRTSPAWRRRHLFDPPA
jgi:glycosyltransferase 2 family protein